MNCCIHDLCSYSLTLHLTCTSEADTPLQTRFLLYIFFKQTLHTAAPPAVRAARNQSGIVIRFDNHMTSQLGGHCKIREFSYSLRFARHLFEYARVIYPQLYSISTRKEGASRVLKTAVEDRRKRCKMLLVE